MTKNKNGVQGLIGLERFTRFGVKTDKAELAFFSVEPTNISVLSAANIDVKIHHLMMLLSTIPDLEILALDSCVNRVDKAISEHGFAARRMSKSDIKRMLALYFGTSLSGDDIPDIEGENEFDLEKQEVTVNEK